MVTSAPPCTDQLPPGAVLSVCVWTTITVRCGHWNSQSSYPQDSVEIRHFPAPPCTPCSLLWFFMCACISTTEACSIVSPRSMEPGSPADLFKTSPKLWLPFSLSLSVNLSCRFTLCLTFWAALLSSRVVNTVLRSCSGLLWIWNMQLQTPWIWQEPFLWFSCTMPTQSPPGEGKVRWKWIILYPEDDVKLLADYM